MGVTVTFAIPMLKNTIKLDYEQIFLISVSKSSNPLRKTGIKICRVTTL